MQVIIGTIAAILGGLALATGVTAAVTVNSAPDKSVNFVDVHTPDPWAGVVNYGTP